MYVLSRSLDVDCILEAAARFVGDGAFGPDEDVNAISVMILVTACWITAKNNGFCEL